MVLIADANDKDAAQALVAGTSLKIPNVVSSTHNTATTFKPYNPNEVIGDTITPPQAPKPKKKKCNAVASIVMVVVAVVVSFFVPGLGGVRLGSLASQAAGKAMVVVDHISLKQALVTTATDAVASLAEPPISSASFSIAVSRTA
ncbi:hypothetical protein ACIP1T_26090 [Pseudomonas japonica]|uniref:hypothetical protein n=1 Tax=Pseudomonas japonica TaxID=256466 RepID=UPI003800B891